MARVIKTLEYSIADVVPYINWLYFFHAWGLSGKPDAEKNALREEAMQMLASMEPRYATHAVFGLFDTETAARAAVEALRPAWPEIFLARPV